MKFAAICNHPMGTPVVQGLLEQGVLTRLAFQPPETSMVAQLRALAGAQQVPMIDFELGGPTDQIQRWLQPDPPDAVLVFGLSLKVPAEALRIPKHGFINFHPGVLPNYRGPAPVFWAIRNREPNGGVTVHQMDEDWDTGPILHVEPEPIGANDTLGMHSFKLAGAAMRATGAVLGPLAQGGVLNPVQQDGNSAGYQGKPTPEDLAVDWENMDADEINALIRAANPSFIGARAGFKGAQVRLQQATVVSSNRFANEPPGKVVTASHVSGIHVACQGGAQLKLDVIGMDAGVFSGTRFMECFGVQAGDMLTPPIV